MPSSKQQPLTAGRFCYALLYNPSYHIADGVAYELTTEEAVPVVERNNHFVPDPLLTSCSISNADYKSSGYDRGHLAPSAPTDIATCIKVRRVGCNRKTIKSRIQTASEPFQFDVQPSQKRARNARE